MIVERGSYIKKLRDDGKVIYVMRPKPADIKAPINIINQLETNEEAEWPFLIWNRPLSAIKYVSLHHSAGSYDIEYWHKLHTDIRRSWSRVGYHCAAAIHRPTSDDVDLYQMNELATVSWHDARNSDTVGFCFGGDLREGHQDGPTEIQLDCFGRWFAWIEPQLPSLEAIVGHQRWSQTACPGDFELWSDKLIDAAAQYGNNITSILSKKKISALGAMATALSRAPRLEAPDG